MGGRLIKPVEEDQIVPDWPEKGPVGRERRKQAYRDQRAADAAQKATEAQPAHVPANPYPGYMRPEAMFPEWDWDGHPEGPPLDDPLVAAYTQLQWRAFLKHANQRRGA